MTVFPKHLNTNFTMILNINNSKAHGEQEGKWKESKSNIR